MTILDELYADADAWLTYDPDPHTKVALAELITAARDGDADALAELRDAFAGDLAFGTAGLRGALGPGTNRMNRVVVTRAAAGLAQYLLARGLGGGRVVIGFDARHNSEAFARDTADVMAGAGFDALLSPGPVPTPVVAYAIRALGCVAGVVVTASHNPPTDNGYKVYLGDGSQIVPPADAEIAAAIEAVPLGDLPGLPRADTWRRWDPEVIRGYVARAAELGARARGADLRWVYTALHGVGSATVRAVIEAAGIAEPIEVAAQAEPDPDFPTVGFPNPEEPGAIDLALAAARDAGVDLVIANDPDADRCAVAVDDGGWRMLSGDELGWLLADDALARGVRGAYACSIVSSVLLERMAADHGQPFVATLTGFKWIGRVPGLAYGYEEAIGYCCDPGYVADKDGITAAVTVLARAAELKAAGSSLAERLRELAARYGEHRVSQLSFRVAEISEIQDAMARLRAAPLAQLAGRPVAYADLAAGEMPGLPPTDGVLFAGDGVRAVVRPSGTEPKLKCYLEVWNPPGQGDSAELAARLDRARTELAASIGL